MRISDWSSDVCSSDLPPTSPTRTIWLRPISSRCWPNGSSDGQAAERKTCPCDRREPGYRRRHRRGAMAVNVGDMLQRLTNDRLPSTTHRVRNPDAGRSEEHTSELQSLMRLSYAGFCLTKKKNSTTTPNTNRD